MKVWYKYTYRLLMGVAGLFFITGCAQPAHVHTPFWRHHAETLNLNVIASDRYQIDGLFYSADSLDSLLKLRITQGIKTPLIIDSGSILNPLHAIPYEEMSRVATIAEKYGISVYHYQFGLRMTPTTSEELLSLKESSSFEEEPVDTDDE